MKILILGATGNSGIRLVRLGLAAKHQVTAFVRSDRKLAELLGGQSPQALAVRTGDVTDEAALAAAMAGQHVVINAAGVLSNTAEFLKIVATVVRTAEKSLGPNGRFWLFGGAGVLDVPGTNTMTVELPMIPKIFRAHKTNFELVSKTKLDWSMMCPGPMTEAPDGKPHQGLRISTDVWPVPRPAITKSLPPHRHRARLRVQTARADHHLRRRRPRDLEQPCGHRALCAHACRCCAPPKPQGAQSNLHLSTHQMCTAQLTSKISPRGDALNETTCRASRRAILARAILFFASASVRR